jgi:hypothetical protein
MTESLENSENEKIPPPPDDTASEEELIAYYTKYDFYELQKAGYYCEMEEVDADDPIHQKLNKLAENGRRRRQLILTFKPDEIAKLSAYAEKVQIPLDTLAKQWILERYQVELAQALQPD